jgi:hypothetical protein
VLAAVEEDELDESELLACKLAAAALHKLLF